MQIKTLLATFIPFALISITIYWAVKKVINEKLTGLFLGFAIILGLAIYHHDLITKWEGFGVKVETIKNQAINDIRKEGDRIRGSLQLIAKEINQATEKTQSVAKEALETAKTANQIAQEAKDQSARFSAVNAEIAWNQLRDEYEEIDNQLNQWEKQKGFKRGGVVPASLIDLDRELRRLKPEVPEQIKRLYRRRYRKYQSLKTMAEQYKPFADRFAHVEFTLPAPPKLPGTILSGGTLRGGTIR